MEKLEKIAKLEAKVKRVFHHPDFDDLSKLGVILGDMPDYQLYLSKREEVHKQRPKASTLDCMRPCYDQPLLTREQESHLFRQFNYFKYRAKRSLGTGDLTRAEKWLERCKEPNHIVAGSNVRLAIPIVKRYRCKHHFEDLVSESFWLICRAVDYFDWTYGTKFSTYATWVIHKTLGRTAQSFYEYEARFQSADDLLVDGIEGRGDEYEEEQSHERVKQMVEELLAIARPRERVIIRQMFLGEKTLKAVGEDLGITKERVRQIKMQGIERIRAALAERGLLQDVA